MRRILIVEDSAATRVYARSALEIPGLGPEEEVEVSEATSGLDALRLLPRGAFDLVITDINMPDINGLELIRFIRQSSRYDALALLIISTQAGERDIERGLALGADGFLPKPFTPEALRDAVAQSFEKRRARAAAARERGDEARD